MIWGAFALSIIIITAPSSCATLNWLDSSVWQFTWDVQNIMAWNTSRSLVWSPFSIANCIGMLALGSAGGTLHRLREVLNVPKEVNNEEFHSSLSNWSLHLDDTDVDIQAAQGLFTQVGTKNVMSPYFLRSVQDFYNASVIEVDFENDGKGAVETINLWVKERTRGKIVDFYSASLPPITNLLLTSAIFFNGKWKTTFSLTIPPTQMMTSSSGERYELPFMTGVIEVPFAIDDSLKCKIFSIPYKGDRYSMYFILPDSQVALPDWKKNVTTADLVALQNAMKPSYLNIKLPKFSISVKLSFSDIFQKMNAQEIIDPTTANYSNITHTRFISLSGIDHQAKIEVDERGTEAVAITGTLVTRGTKQWDHVVVVDHPFVFYIADNVTGLVLFWGQLDEKPL